MARTRRRVPIDQRFWAQVSKTATCWLWLGGQNGTGYGTFYVDGRRRYAHRWSYERFIGPIPPGLQLDHLCRVRHCVAPSHLEPVTAKENQRRGMKGQQTHCMHGHAFDDANTYVKSNGTRACKRCRRDRMRTRDGFKDIAHKTHCMHGHAFTPENTYIRPNGTRACKTCRRLRNRR